MPATVVEVPDQGHRAICEDPACAKTVTGIAYTMTVQWRTWITSALRANVQADDHNRARHGAK